MDYNPISIETHIVMTDNLLLIKVKPIYQIDEYYEYSIFPMTEVEMITWNPSQKFCYIELASGNRLQLPNVKRFDDRLINVKIGA